MASNKPKSKTIKRKANGKRKPGRKTKPKPKLKFKKPKAKKFKAKSKSKKTKKVATKKSQPKKIKARKPIGAVTHYFSNISVAIVKFSKNVSVGADLYFKGATTDFKQKLSEMQYNHQPIKIAKKGKEVGIKVKDMVREGDKVL